MKLSRNKVEYMDSESCGSSMLANINTQASAIEMIPIPMHYLKTKHLNIIMIIIIQLQHD